MVINPEFWANKRVLVTGHSGFKGGWLSLMLNSFGADVHGISLPPKTTPSFFESVRLAEHIKGSFFIDINDFEAVSRSIQDIEPEIVFHMAAQPLVRYSYVNPMETFQTNVMGTVHILDVLRRISSETSCLVVTTDKVYRNREWDWGYRENDELGGHDPYSYSKACAEFVVDSYRNSFFSDGSCKVATARAGNVIGGGDWSEDRLLVDAMRSLFGGGPLVLRNPSSVRPWQHVLEPLVGYVELVEKMGTGCTSYRSSWNFGPNNSDAVCVSEVVKQLELLSGRTLELSMEPCVTMKETKLLRLDNSKAATKLDWKPVLSVHQALDLTYAWYEAFHGGADMTKVSLEQIDRFLVPR